MKSVTECKKFEIPLLIVGREIPIAIGDLLFRHSIDESLKLADRFRVDPVAD